MPSRWTSLGVSVACHAAVLIAGATLFAFDVGGPRTSNAGRVRLEAGFCEPEQEAPREQPVLLLEDVLPPWIRPSEPRLPDADPLPVPEGAEDHLPRFEAADVLVFSEVPVSVAGVSLRPVAVEAAPAPIARPAPPRRRLVPVVAPRHYPLAALRAGLGGRVLVAIEVDPAGRIATARVVESSGHALLDAAALDAVRRWRFKPPGETRQARVPFTYAAP